MFAAYGYKSSNYTGLTTPVALPESNCKNLSDINFTCDELEKYVGKFCGKYFRNLNLPSISKLCKYIQVVARGHVGLVCHILRSIEDTMRKQIDTFCLTWEEMLKYLNSKEFDLSIYANCCAVPKFFALSVKQRSICENVYLKGKIFYTDSDKDAVYLVRSGTLIINNIYINFCSTSS